MKELIEKYGWYNYASGCPCIGLPRFYRHSDYPDYKIILKNGFATIKRNGAELLKTKDVEILKSKMKEYEIIKEIQDVDA